MPGRWGFPSICGAADDGDHDVTQRVPMQGYYPLICEVGA